MQSRNRFFDDLAKVAGGAAGTFSELQGEIEALVRQRIERIASELNLVTRDEFETVRAVATAARTEQERLEKRIAELEAQLKSKKSAGTRAKRESSVNKTNRRTRATPKPTTRKTNE